MSDATVTAGGRGRPAVTDVVDVVDVLEVGVGAPLTAADPPQRTADRA